MKILIIGRRADTFNYERYIASLPAVPVTALNPGEIASCQGLLLPGGGDITPAFFGENNRGSRQIDTELDILQLQALDYAIRRRIPVLGICKGMQVINVAFGGTITQHLPTASLHQYCGQDQYHVTSIQKGSCLHTLYGESAIVNSAHHQSIKNLGNGLLPIQWCPLDGCIEALVHRELPILGLQWHPERLDPQFTPLSGHPILSLFSSLICASRLSFQAGGE